MQQSPTITPEKIYLLDYPATVNALTIQFLSEHEETRVAALKRLIMLHQKSPKVRSLAVCMSRFFKYSLDPGYG